MNLKTNYDLLMQQQINNFTNKKKLLLHCCCGPCSTAVLEKLQEHFDITIFFYNPNIYPKQEFLKRLLNQEKVSKFFNNIKVVTPDYQEHEFLNNIKGLEKEKEGGLRCDKCFEIRLRQTAKYAKEKGYDIFGTTLTVSSHKNEQNINKIGKEIELQEGIEFLYSDFKKHDGYKRSIVLSNEMNLYRQNYCGCRFSIRTLND